MQTKTAKLLGMCIITAFLLLPSTSSSYAPLSDISLPNPVIEKDITIKSPTENYRNSDTELYCLARVVFFEARSQSDVGKLAVADVTINRTASPNFPKSICGVIKQHGQFNWKVREIKIKELGEWQKALVIAKKAVQHPNAILPKNVFYFHVDRISPPKWTRNLKRFIHIEDHIFYTSRDVKKM
jgi:spore germination cell wall hydrolase CwlJ-like protein